MRLVEALIRRRVLTTVLVLIAIILGLLSYAGLGLRRFPEIEFPVATVMTRYPGGSPAEIESDVTKPIEDAVSSISSIEEISSYSQKGLSLVMIQFELEADIDLKAVDVRNQVDLVRANLPDAAEDPVVLKFEFSQFPVITLAITGERDVNELYRIADEDLSTIISQVPGVAEVQLTGGQQREVHVLLSANRLRKHRVPIGAVVGALQLANLDVPAGHITEPGREYIIRATGRFEDVEEINRVRVPTGGSSIVTVGDLGKVRDTYEERRTSSRFDGQRAVVLAVQAQTDANEVEVVDEVLEQMPRLQRALPPGARIEVAEDTSEYIRGALANVRNNMIIGILLTACVLYLFLKSWRSTLVAAVVMPAAVVISFVGIRASGFSLNIISLTGLAIVIGVLVNNAILVLENVTRFVGEGEEPTEAAVKGTRGIALAIFSSTATNLVVFLPIAFMGEMIGQFFRELGLTVVYATVASLAISFSLTPMMCGLLLRREEDPSGRLSWLWDHTVGLVADGWRAFFRWLKGVYLAVLGWCLHYRRLTVLLTLLVFVVSLGIFPILGAEFMPRSDEGRFRITVTCPAGTPLAVTDGIVERVEQEVEKLPYLKHQYSRVGEVSGFLGGSSEGVHLGEVSVTVADRAERPLSLDDLMSRLRPRLADLPIARLAVQESGGGPVMAPVEVEISGDDLRDIQRIASGVLRLVKDVPGTAETSKSWQAGQPELRVLPRREALNRHRLDFGTVAQDIRSYVEGRTATQFRDRDENYDLVVQLQEEDRQRVAEVPRMFVYAPATGRMLRISEVAELREAPSPTLIMRKDRQRLLTVSAQLTGERPLDKVLEDVRARIDAELEVPSGVTVDFAGQAELMRENFRELFRAMATAAVLTFLCVAGIIESFAFGLIIIASLPVCMIGVALAMLLGGVSVNVFSLMAMIILIGMVVNNAIIIVDYAIRRQGDGLSALEAVRDACDVRFRMIVMANMTTIIALTPLSLGLGFAGELFRPLALVEMGGVFAAGVLSLLVIPAVYVILKGRKQS